MASRCGDYLAEADSPVDIDIREADYKPERWPTMSYENMCYMESGEIFYLKLLRHSGMMLHSSAIAFRGNAYLFSGPSGVGKSTHTRQWQQTFGDAVQVFNDDKPALRYVDGRWYAYGTPWCGKDGINQNKKVPLAGICFLKQGRENRIRRLTPAESVARVMSQTYYRYRLAENMDLLLNQIDKLVREIPIYELENFPGEEAVRLSSRTLCGEA